MKRFSLVTIFAVFFALVSARGVHAALHDSLQGAFFSAFRSAQSVVEGVRTRVIQFLGIRREEPESPPSLRILPFGGPSEFLVGTEQEIRWTYENLRESVTKITLFPEGRPAILLLFLPAKRNAFGSDAYLFPAQFDRGVYRIQICNGDTCDVTNPFFIAIPTPEIPAPPFSDEFATTSLPFLSTSTTTLLPTTSTISSPTSTTP